MARAIVLQKFSKVDRYHIILQNLLQNFSYLHWMGITISAKEGTLAKDRTYPVIAIVLGSHSDSIHCEHSKCATNIGLKTTNRKTNRNKGERTNEKTPMGTNCIKQTKTANPGTKGRRGTNMTPCAWSGKWAH